MSRPVFDPIPLCPCEYCKPPKRNAECHAKCKEYLDWEKEKNRIKQAIWDYEDGVRYRSQAMAKIEKRNKLQKPRRHSFNGE